VKVSNVLAIFKATVAIMFETAWWKQTTLDGVWTTLTLDQSMLSVSFRLWIQVTFFQRFL
jgi:hypothetical protein